MSKVASVFLDTTDILVQNLEVLKLLGTILLEASNIALDRSPWRSSIAAPSK